MSTRTSAHTRANLDAALRARRKMEVVLRRTDPAKKPAEYQRLARLIQVESDFITECGDIPTEHSRHTAIDETSVSGKRLLQLFGFAAAGIVFLYLKGVFFD